eukprot:182609-Rhodomonas_salina.2
MDWDTKEELLVGAMKLHGINQYTPKPNASNHFLRAHLRPALQLFVFQCGVYCAEIGLFIPGGLQFRPYGALGASGLMHCPQLDMSVEPNMYMHLPEVLYPPHDPAYSPPSIETGITLDQDPR